MEPAGRTYAPAPDEAPEAEPATAVADAPASSRPVPPSSYRLVAPVEWFRIPLASAEARERSVRALVNRTLPNRDEFTTKRHELKQLIDNLTWEAASKDGLEMYLSTQTVLGVPISASLVVTAESPEEDSGIGVIPVRLMAEAQQDKYPQAEVEVVDLPAGRSVRVRRQERPQDASDLGLPEGRTSTLLTYFVQIPESPTHLVLSFNTPLTELADALVELFDAVANSLSWEYPEPLAGQSAQ